MDHSNYISCSLGLLIIINIFCFCTSSSQKYSNIPRIEDIPYLGNALRKGLTYIKYRNDTKSLDVALGITLVKGSLQWIRNRVKQEINFGSKFITKINELYEFSENIFSEIYSIFQISENSIERKFSGLLRFLFNDIVAEDLKYGRLNKTVVQLPNFENCSFINDYILKGTPEDSDVCIAELFDEYCKISSYCWFQETNHLGSAGYKTSHRLLYIQLLMKLNCNKGNEHRMERMKMSMCQSMLEEAIALYGKNMFFARDLFLEQIALCGFDGYIEFAERDWSIEIPKWQHSDGCFGILHGEQLPEEYCLEWKSDLKKKWDDPCSTHLTAVAISAIAFHLRVAFEKS